MAKKNMAKKDNWILRNIIAYVAAVVVLISGISVFLTLVTDHGKEIRVPDLSNLTVSEAASVASGLGLRVSVHDSLYQRGLKPGVVFEQDPHVGSRVKKGRRIQLRVNTKVAKKIPMPSLVGFSTRQARAELVRNGLLLGKLLYVRDIATNNVLKQMCGGREVPAGKMVTSGSTIDLVVGLSSSENMTFVPDVIGRDFRRAVDILHDNSLNVGNVRFDSRVKTYSDSLNAVVYSQSPITDSELVTMGTNVTLLLTSDPVKIAKLREQ